MAQNKYRKKNRRNDNRDVLGIMLVVVSAFLLLCIVIKPILGIFSEAIFAVMLGLFGIFSYPMLFAILLLGVFILMRRSSEAEGRTIVGIALAVLFALVILQLASTHRFLNNGLSAYIDDVYAAKYSAGGIIVGLIAYGLQALIGEVLSYVVLSLALIIDLASMFSLVSRLRDFIYSRGERLQSAQQNEQAETLPKQAQRVVTAQPPPGLFVYNLQTDSREIGSETGYATDIPTDGRRKVSDYSHSPVMEKGSDDEARSAAHYKLYGDSEEIKRQATEEFRKANAASRPIVEEKETYVEVNQDRDEEIMEPSERIELDASKADKPRRLDYEGMPGNLHALYFPPEKNIRFNDYGIETIEDYRPVNTEKERGDEPPALQRKAVGAAPSFDIPKHNVSTERVETIIDASLPLQPEPQEQPVQSDLAYSQSADDRFFRALEESAYGNESKKPPLESDKFKTDGIIDAYEESTKYAAIHSAPAREMPREEILDGSMPYEPEQPRSETPRIIRQSPIDEDGILDGSLVISDEPAVDLTQHNFDGGDLFTGRDLSGMYISADDENEEEQKPVVKPQKRQKNAPLENQITFESVLKEKAEESVMSQDVKKYKKYDYTPPPFDLLKIYEKTESAQDELQNNAQTLEEVVSRFLKTQVKVINIVPGPQVTRYELDVPLGTSVKSIELHCADIAYELAAVSGVRVEAPIPGKRAVGIEVPNKTKSIVGLREVVDSNIFIKHKSPLVFAVGKDIGGELVVCDLEKIPHLLIAGQTGSGKSAGLNSLIVSLLYKSSPDDLRLILIDPKRVEFSKFRGMPHLLFEKTITEPIEALNALKWADAEMNRRYIVLQKYSCSKLSEYNNLPEVKSGKIGKLPHIIVIIDELANLMQSSVSGEIESEINSIAALARAAGIHLIVATQRPSADVITGTIKSNLTSRIAFKVPDATNSRIIIDVVGAEALAGDGDMLFYPQDAYAARRVQGSFVNGEEVLSVVGYLKENYECDFDEDAEKFVIGGKGDSSSGGGNTDGNSDIDPLASRIMAHAIKSKQISVSVIQRRFSIGYARAARILDSMEELDYVGPSTGNSKPRDVMMTVEQYREVFGHDLEES